jgi:hypothetical protein
MPREAAALLADDRARRVGAAVGMAPLAHASQLSRSTTPPSSLVIITEVEPRWSVWKPAPAQAGVARRRGLVRLLDEDADEPPADDEVVGPAHPAAAHAGQALRERPGAGEVERLPRGAELGEAADRRDAGRPGLAGLLADRESAKRH